MKRLLLATFAAAAGVAAWAAGPAAIYINNSPVSFTNVAPQVNAVAFLNRSVFEVTTYALPYQAQNVKFWTNSGVMSGNIGFLFERDSDGTSTRRRRRVVRDSRYTQLPSAVFHNDGQISGSTILSVRATNIVMPGRLDGAEAAKVRLSATNGYADLSRGGIRVGSSIDPSFNCDTFSVSTNFFPDANITDLYWGAGRNNALATNAARPLNLPTLNNSNFFGAPSFNLPFPQSPFHQVMQRFGRSTFTNTVSVGGLFGNGCGSSNYAVFVHTNFDTLTSSVVSVVFVPTNNTLTASNFSADVRFYPNFFSDVGNTYAAVVEFRSVDFDIVNQQYVTNYVTLVDASAGETNIVLARPFATLSSSAAQAATRRPSTYTWIKGRFCSFDFASPTNASFDPNIFYSPLMTTNVASLLYAASSVQIGQSNSQSITTPQTIISSTTLQLGVNPGLSDPTNFSGHISIEAKELNLASTRIRSEDYIGIRTANLVSNAFAELDAPFIDFDVGTTNSTLIITNVAPAKVNRLVGTAAAWSGVWDVDSTNTIGLSTNLVRTRFHVLIVDHCLQADQPVTMHRFKVKAPSTIIHDNIRVNSGLLIDSRDLTLQTNGVLTLPVNYNFSPSNVIDLLNFTNFSSLYGYAGVYLGTFEAGHIPTNTPPKKRFKRRKPQPVPGPFPLDNFVNHGLITAASILVKATNAQSSGQFQAPAQLIADGGVVLMTASSLNLSNTEVTASSDIEFHGDNLSFASTRFSAGIASNAVGQYIRGAIVIDATNSFGDLSGVTTNDWFVTSGFRFSTIPAVMGDLMGSRVYSSAGPLVSSTIVWPGQNRGATPNGFFNNLALGRLVLDGRGGNLFRFKGTGESNAIYVDYLELANFATNYNVALGIDPDFTIFFANSSPPPEKLNDLVNNRGRLVWVSDFVGPQSATNILYPNGTSYTMNAALARSTEIDSDGDGIVNALDCTPIIPPGQESNRALWFGANCVGSGGAAPVPPQNVAAASAATGVYVSIELSQLDGQVALSWDVPAGAASTVEFSDQLGARWQTLTNLISGPVNTRVTVKDAAGTPLRVYRVRVDAVNQQ